MQRMHWSYQQLMALPVRYYEPCVEMLNEDDRTTKAANERARMSARRR